MPWAGSSIITSKRMMNECSILGSHAFLQHCGIFRQEHLAALGLESLSSLRIAMCDSSVASISCSTMERAKRRGDERAVSCFIPPISSEQLTCRPSLPA
jgi:hypothetical protein